MVYVHEMIHAYLRLNYNNDVGFNDWIRKIEEPIVESTMLKFFEDFDNEEILELAKEHVKRKQYSLGIEFYGFGYYIYQNAKVIECLEQYRKTKPRLSRSIPDVENYLNFWSSGAYPRNQESECLEVLWDAIGRKINPKRILEKLKEKKNRGVLPSYLSLLSNEIDFGQYLSACPSINTSRSSYLNSLRKHEFQDLLDKHYLPLDLYSCQNLYGLVEVLDKLVYHPKTPEVAAALNYGGCSCRYALCYYIKHLLYINHITV